MLNRTRNLRRKEADRKKTEFRREEVQGNAGATPAEEADISVEAGNASKTNDSVLTAKPKLEAKKKVYTIEANVSLQPDLKVEIEAPVGDPADTARQERLRKQKEKQVCTVSCSSTFPTTSGCTL